MINIKDKKIIDRVIENIKKSQKKYNNNNCFKKDTKCLLCENFELKDNTINIKGFCKKGKYSIPCFVTTIELIFIKLNFHN